MSFLKRLEDRDHPLLGPTLYGLKLWRIWQPERTTPIIIYNFTHAFGTLFVLTQYLELWLIRDNMELALRNLSFTMLSTICVVKSNSFIYKHQHWEWLIDYVSKMEQEQLSKKDQTTASAISEYTKYSRRITYFYWSLVTATVFLVVLAPLFGFVSSSDYRYLIRNGTASYPEIFSSWLPFDRTRGWGYWTSVLEHSAICVYGGGVVANYDSHAVVLMTFLKGQLKLLQRNCAKMFGDNKEQVSYNEAIKRIGDCHNHHVGLIKFSSLLNSLLSPVMFLYVIICSLMICASAIQLTNVRKNDFADTNTSLISIQRLPDIWGRPLSSSGLLVAAMIMEGTGTMQRIWITEYLLALIAQLFIYCWHSNEVFYMSNKVEEGVYSSAWWTQNVRIRRSVILLGGQMRRSIVFTAGPFTDLTVPTFVAILKGSYSYYTLLTQK